MRHADCHPTVRPRWLLRLWGPVCSRAVPSGASRATSAAFADDATACHKRPRTLRLLRGGSISNAQNAYRSVCSEGVGASGALRTSGGVQDEEGGN